jgi:hypothetical protein
LERAGSEQSVGRECVAIDMNMVISPLAKTAAAKRLRDAGGIASGERTLDQNSTHFF